MGVNVETGLAKVPGLTDCHLRFLSRGESVRVRIRVEDWGRVAVS
jgi:hypothetical protein